MTTHTADETFYERHAGVLLVVAALLTAAVFVLPKVQAFADLGSRLPF